jgi:hypothetical protein
MPRRRREIERLVLMHLRDDCRKDAGPRERFLIHELGFMIPESTRLLIAF